MMEAISLPVYGELTLDDVRVNGALELLEKLTVRVVGNSLYLASGSDIGAVAESTRLLGYGKHFGDRIVAAGSTDNPEVDAKQMIINKMISEKNLKRGQLVCFGDGWPEMLYTYLSGGVCVGVLTPDVSDYEPQDYFTLKQKRRRLITAGAHILVSDFSYASKLVEVVRSRHPKYKK